MRQLLAITAALAVSACTHDIEVNSSSAASSEVMANRIIQRPAFYVFSDDLKDLNKDVHYPGMRCSAHDFPLQLGNAVTETLRKATEAGFAHVESAGAGTPPPQDGYLVRFSFEDLTTNIGMTPGFFEGTAHATVELTVRVAVADSNGTDVAKAVLDGEGSADAGGDCPAAGDALQQASEKAVKRLGLEYVDKIINTNVLK
jgi:hypothetical protein